uniref:uncharacterized protein LOC120330439 n=1 Tax=Styela clava TaxID=7725 RepID=UPI00193A8414|nr:uncharacterized protein LOC120330439 [Styela clava]
MSISRYFIAIVLVFIVGLALLFAYFPSPLKLVQQQDQLRANVNSGKTFNYESATQDNPTVSSGNIPEPNSPLKDATVNENVKSLKAKNRTTNSKETLEAELDKGDFQKSATTKTTNNIKNPENEIHVTKGRVEKNETLGALKATNDTFRVNMAEMSKFANGTKSLKKERNATRLVNNVKKNQVNLKAHIQAKMRQLHLRHPPLNSNHSQYHADFLNNHRHPYHEQHQKHELRHFTHHVHRPSRHQFNHHFFLNQFIYVLKGVRFCVFQYVKKKCSLHVLYQSMNFEPVTIFIADAQNLIVHENKLHRSGSYHNIPKTSGSFKVCIENYSWGPKKIFLSIRVENHWNSLVMNMSHYHGYTTLGRIRNLELEVRTMVTQLSQKRAAAATDLILSEDKIEFSIWMTWVVLIVSLMTYILEVIEIHRIFRIAEATRTFSMDQIGRRRLLTSK